MHFLCQEKEHKIRLTNGVPVCLDEADVGLHHRPLVLDPVPAAVLVGVEAALAEALDVVGQHLTLVVVGSVFLKIKFDAFISVQMTAIEKSYDGLFQVLVDQCQQLAVVPGGDLEGGALELLLEEGGVVDAGVPGK